jgi:hypothetical protein
VTQYPTWWDDLLVPPERRVVPLEHTALPQQVQIHHPLLDPQAHVTFHHSKVAMPEIFFFNLFSTSNNIVV